MSQDSHFHRNFSIVWASWNEWEQCSIRYKGFPAGGKYPEGLKVSIKLLSIYFLTRFQGLRIRSRICSDGNRASLDNQSCRQCLNANSTETDFKKIIAKHGRENNCEYDWEECEGTESIPNGDDGERITSSLFGDFSSERFVSKFLFFVLL